MKRGIKVETLEIDPARPPVFDINIQPGPIVQIYGTAEAVSEVVINNKQRFRLVPVLCFDVDHDAAPIDRRFVLLPVMTHNEGGYIEDDKAIYSGMFINPLNKLPLAIYEVPWTVVAVDENAEVTPDGMLAILKDNQTQETP